MMTQIVMPMHTNGVAGVMFGGVMMQWIDVCDQVPAHAVGIDQLHHVSFLGGLFARFVSRQKRRIAIDSPAEGHVGDAGALSPGTRH